VLDETGAITMTLGEFRLERFCVKTRIDRELFDGKGERTLDGSGC
jgi:hypothetical protein